MQAFAHSNATRLHAPEAQRNNRTTCRSVAARPSGPQPAASQCRASNLSSRASTHAALIASRSLQVREGSRSFAVAVTASSVPAGSVSVVLLAGGVGKRMGANMPKQYIKLRGQEIALYSMQTFAGMPVAEIGEIVVVCDQSYRDVFEGCTLPRQVPVKFAAPGKERQDSVESGLKSIADSAQLVAVHDSARPLVTVKEISNVLADAMKHGAAVLGVQTKATIKQAKPDQFVEKTLDRSLLWEMHTPQVIRPKVLRDGFRLVAEKGLAVTDDVSIVEAMGLPVFITKGEYTNLKITTPEDLFIAERLLDEQREAK